ncbi:MAG TPA: hypothetical protein DEP84_19420 [Chloroflexi bacterium]|nr:hypothetical protein [Chloroflexota bacterium]
MSNKPTSIVIIARPSLLRDGLQAVLTAIPQTEIVGQVADGASALTVVSEQHPALVVFESDRPGKEVWTVLQHIKAESPETCCIVLTDDAGQQGAATAAGADLALLKGFPAEKLFATIEHLLQKNEP